jgi:hypothetical protein
MASRIILGFGELGRLTVSALGRFVPASRTTGASAQTANKRVARPLTRGSSLRAMNRNLLEIWPGSSELDCQLLQPAR